MAQLDIFHYPRSRLKDVDLALASSLEGMLEKEVTSKRLELKEDYENLLRPSLEKILVGIGMQKMLWPEALGGEDHNKPDVSYTIVSALEQAARADVGLAFLAAHSLSLQAAMALEGNYDEDACRAFAPLFCDGSAPVIVSFVLATYGKGEVSPLKGGKYPQVIATSAGDGWVLNGKDIRPSCSGADADLFGVLCSVESEDEPAFVVMPGDASGLYRGAEFKKTGLAASRNAEISLSDVKVPAVNCLWRGEEGFRRLLSWYYLGLAGAGVGALLASYELIKEWGDTRVIKGRGHIFKDNPLTAALMGEIAKEISVSRLLAYDLAGLLAEPETYGDAGSQSIFVAASMIAHDIYSTAENTIHRIMELMASAGYAKEWQLERYWRDVKTVQCYMGSAELAKHDYARWFYQTKTL
jgi:alkylation response protein AidB-like acyl-CoA dehydrogenase